MDFDIFGLKGKDRSLVDRVIDYLENDMNLDVELRGSAREYVDTPWYKKMFKSYNDVDLLVKYSDDPASKHDTLQAVRELREAYVRNNASERADMTANVPEFAENVTGYNFASLSEKQQTYCLTIVGNRFQIREDHAFGKPTVIDLSFETEHGSKSHPIYRPKKNLKSTVSFIERLFNPHVTDRISPRNKLVRSDFQGYDN
jgi:hypothetical protein